MYERLLITLAATGSFAVIYLFMKRRQLVKASRASQQAPSLSRIPTIVYFWSPGCPVCKVTQRKVLDEIVAEYGKERLTLTDYNTDEKLDVAQEWGVRTLPTTYVLDSTGAIRHVNSGLAIAETLRKQLEPMIDLSSL